MSNATILIVEDDAILAMNLERMVTLQGHNVRGPVASGEDALAFLEEEKVDLVLMDIELAGTMNGIAAAEIISRTFDIPIVFLTGFSHDPLLEHAKLAAPYGYLIKPVPERELAATLEMALHRHKLDIQLKESQAALTISEAKYRHLFENSPLGIFRTTLDGRVLAVNAEMVRIFGCDSPEEVLRDFTDLAQQFYVDPNRRRNFIAQLRTQGIVQHFECEIKQRTGSTIWISMSAKLTQNDAANGQHNEQTVIDGFAMDVTERKRIEYVQAFLAQASDGTDSSFFNKLAEFLADSLKMDFVCIDYLEGDGLNARTVAVWHDGHFEDNVTYALKDTPCGEVVEKTVCCYPASVCQFFPKDQVLQDLKAESYVGTTLFSHTGQPIGLIAVVGRTSIVNRPLAEMTLAMVAVRAAGEMERQQAETALRESQIQHQTLFHEMLDGFALHEIICNQEGNPVDYRFLAVNPAFERMTGLKATDLVGRTVLEVLPQTEPYWIDTYGQVALSGKPFHFENYSVDLHKHFEVSAFQPMPNCFACTFIDITERKQAEEAQRESELLFETLVNTIPDLIWLKDIDGVYLSCNKKFERFFGVSVADILGKTDYDFVDKELADFFREKDRKAITVGGPSRNEEQIFYADDGRKAFLETIKTPMFGTNGKLIGVLGIGRDITERKQAEAKLAESEGILKDIVESTLSGFWDWNLVANTEYLSPTFKRMFGYEDHEMENSPESWQKIIFPEDLPGVLEVFDWHIKSRGQEPFYNEIRYRHKDGSTVWVICAGRVIEWAEDGVPIRMVGCHIDITERKQFEAEREKLQAQLQQAQKMEAIGTLAGGIAHDFNNILGAILGYTEIAVDSIPPDSIAVGYLEKVAEASHRASSLVKQILAFSRQANTEDVALQPAAIIKEAIKILRPSLPSTITIKQQIYTATKSILADPSQLHQILMNLCTNAYHAMEERGGILEITLEDRELFQDDLENYIGVSPGIFVVLTVGDSGPGITAEIRDKIFDPYFTTKEVGKGTGMGLAIVHGIVKRHGGFITCETTLGKGTVFEVYFPAIEQVLTDPDTTVENIVTGKERILFIDDEEILVDLGKTMLERLGYEVATLTSSLEAWNTFSNRPDQFDIVITDQTMPGLTGSDLALKMLQLRPNLPIILCTGYSSLISEKKAKSMGIQGFAMKPLVRKEISLLLRELLDERSARSLTRGVGQDLKDGQPRGA